MKKPRKIHPAAHDAYAIGKQICKAILAGHRIVSVEVGWKPEPWIEIRHHPNVQERKDWKEKRLKLTKNRGWLDLVDFPS